MLWNYLAISDSPSMLPGWFELSYCSMVLGLSCVTLLVCILEWTGRKEKNMICKWYLHIYLTQVWLCRCRRWSVKVWDFTCKYSRASQSLQKIQSCKPLIKFAGGFFWAQENNFGVGRTPHCGVVLQIVFWYIRSLVSPGYLRRWFGKQKNNNILQLRYSIHFEGS
jgi:hypothetical protein